ncbi:MAG: glycosyltransferase [Bacteroidales bacterium]|nr:glycosyltransferase [Bacteroidales bacterium]
MSADVIFLESKNFFKRFIEIRRVIKDNNIDLIWTWGGIESTYGILLSATSRVKHINGSIRHGIVRFNKHQLWRMFVLHLSKHIVANSNAGLRANRIKRGSVLRNGIDQNFFIKPDKESSEIRKELGIESDVVLLTSVANLIPYKDYNTVLNALSIINAKGIKIHYIAIGEGFERRRLEELVEHLSLSKTVSFIGNRLDIKDILYASDIFIHSSLGEGCSNAILEAMSAGLPIIASDTGGTGEVINDFVGRLFEFQNIEQLTNMILELICNKQLREKLAENAKKKAVGEFSIDTMMFNYYHIVNRI